MGITGINLKLLEQLTYLLNNKKNIPLQQPNLLYKTTIEPSKFKTFI